MNIQREVYISPLSLNNNNIHTDLELNLDTKFIYEENNSLDNKFKSVSKWAIPVYVFKKDDLSEVLYIFSSLTKLKK